MGRLLRLLKRRAGGGGFDPLSRSPLMWFDSADPTTMFTDGCAVFVAASNTNLFRSQQIIPVSGSDWSVGIWFNTTDVGSNRSLMIQGIDFTFLLISHKTNGTVVVNRGGTTGQLVSTGTVSTNSWHYAVVTYSTATNTLSFYLDGVFQASSANTVAPAAQTDFGLGFGNGEPYNGSIDATGIWLRTLSSGDVTGLYNGGSGKTYSGLSTADKVSLTAWWNLDEATGNRLDSSGNARTLTANNGVGSASGIVSGRSSVNGDPISLWFDKSGNFRSAGFASMASRPTYSTTLINGNPTILFDGVDDNMVLASNMALTGAFTVYAVGNRATSTTWIPVGAGSTVATVLLYGDGKTYMEADDGVNGVNIAVSPTSGNIIARWRRDASSKVYFRATGQTEMLLGTKGGTLTLNRIGGRPTSNQWTTGRFTEIFVQASDSGNGTDAYADYLAAKWGLTF